MLTLIKNLLDSNEREIKKLQKYIDKINSYEKEFEKLTDNLLKAKTDEFKQRLGKGETLDDIMCEAFAVVREVSKRTMGMRHFDVQLIGGIVLHQGRIAEMKTGEGKTLVATLPVYLNALEGKGVHVVTVNDYLAKRDAKWMAPIYDFLGLSVGIIQHDIGYLYDPSVHSGDESIDKLKQATHREAYNADITYGTNNEYGFDYLKDNMVIDIKECAQRELNYAIVDEVDSILIDEARTPLIISGIGEKSTDLYQKFSKVVNRLNKNTDYHVEEKAHSAPLTEEGVKRVEKEIGLENLYDNQNMEIAHHINQALRAKELYKRDVDYVIKEGEIIIVDEFTGRLMFGRRYSDGLHQAIEAKEGVKIKHENQTLASITFQNYFRLYKKLSGMTGTAATEEKEFRGIYNLDVVIIPTNMPMVRADYADQIYKHEEAKFKAAIEEIAEMNTQGRPVLVGTRSIEKSELLSSMLSKRGVKHEVLNAKYHEKEASIIAQAGRRGAVTIATNMAGRGVDIVLGGSPLSKEAYEEIKELGGLHIIGTERHESRRIDNQLRGRSGRQGDSGSSRFFVALNDELMRLFGSDKISVLMDRLGVDENIPIEHAFLTKAIENAQKRVESHNYEIRKSVLEYDDVMNKQREVIYNERRKILLGENLKPHILDMVKTHMEKLVDTYAPKEVLPDDWDIDTLFESLKETIPMPAGVKIGDLSDTKQNLLKEKITDWAYKAYEEKETHLTPETMRQLERYILLQIVDTKWIDHLYSMDLLREGIGLRAYGQKDPRIEYINEAFEAFEALKSNIQEDAVKFIYRVQLVKPEEQKQAAKVTSLSHGDAEPKTPVRREEKVGRNDPCPCGSGRKHKKCCGG
ncbi:MAG: preprotein translocase subunit SecA [Armatimonadota bacterium]